MYLVAMLLCRITFLLVQIVVVDVFILTDICRNELRHLPSPEIYYQHTCDTHFQTT